MGYVIVIAKTNVSEFPNYWVGYNTNREEAIKTANRMLGKPLKGYDQCQGETPTKIIVAEEIEILSI